MELKKSELYVLVFTALYIIGFGSYYVAIKNFEFLWYVAVLIFFAVLIGATLHKSRFPSGILWGLSGWGLLHMAGGGVKVAGDVLYNLRILPLYVTENLYVLKFDQVVHAYGFGVAAFVAWHLLKDYWNEKANYKIVYPAIVAIAMGLGALNEIVEFLAVLAIPDTNVGGYYNTGLDIIFNTIGAIIAIVIIHLKRKEN